MSQEKKGNEKNLAYGGMALIEGVLMRGQSTYAYTVKKPDDKFCKYKEDYVSLGKKIKILGFPFTRGIAGMLENLFFGLKLMNKSAEIAFPEDFKKDDKKKSSDLIMVLIVLLSLFFSLLIFVALPYILTNLFPLNMNKNPFLFNMTSGLIRMLFFFIYIVLISLTKDAKRLFGFHGAEHKTINAYEADLNLSLDNVKSKSRLHPRCGTSFIFIVFLITLLVFPLFNMFFNTQEWYNQLLNFGKIGKVLQNLVHIASHIFLGMPIVASISYELLKVSQKLQKYFFMKLLIAPGLFFQLFTTREPDEVMLRASILSLKMVIGDEEVNIERDVTSDLASVKMQPLMTVFLLPLTMILNLI